MFRVINQKIEEGREVSTTCRLTEDAISRRWSVGNRVAINWVRSEFYKKRAPSIIDAVVFDRPNGFEVLCVVRDGFDIALEVQHIKAFIREELSDDAFCRWYINNLESLSEPIPISKHIAIELYEQVQKLKRQVRGKEKHIKHLETRLLQQRLQGKR